MSNAEKISADDAKDAEEIGATNSPVAGITVEQAVDDLDATEAANEAAEAQENEGGPPIGVPYGESPYTWLVTAIFFTESGPIPALWLVDEKTAQFIQGIVSRDTSQYDDLDYTKFDCWEPINKRIMKMTVDLSGLKILSVTAATWDEKNPPQPRPVQDNEPAAGRTQVA